MAITSTPAGGGGSTTTSYVWCGSQLCQARSASGTPTREYLAEGEYVPGSPGQAYYYGVDQIGSVRRVFASASSGQAYAYDPYGNALQGTAPETDFGYAGLFYNADSGLDLAGARAYDPTTGRWLSRDPLGEGTDPQGNLYAYVGGSPVGEIDPSGQFGLIGAGIGATAFGAGDLAYQLYNNGGNTACVNWGQVVGAAGLGFFIGSGTEFLAGLGEAAEEATGLGDLTASEINQIQNVVNAAGRPLDVVGSAARAARTATSDIDYTTANANFGNFEGLEGQLPRIDPEHGLLRGYADPDEGPSIRFEPGSTPYFVPGAP